MNAVAEHMVVIAGGGPTGLMLAGELTIAGVDVVVVERRHTPELVGSRARGVHSRTIEVLDQRGIDDRFLAEGKAVQLGVFAGVRLDISAFPTRHNYGLALNQSDFERILGSWVDELGVPIVRGCDVTGFAQDDAGVDVELSDGARLRAQFLVGCDGGRSIVRKTAGIEFPGWEPSISSLIAEVHMHEEPQLGIRHDENGTQAMGRLEDGRVGIVVSERYAGQPPDPTLDDVRRALVAVWGTDFGVHDPTWISRFTDATRQAATYRQGRVLVAGDAAHVHYPVGGQGLNLGLQDAVNLGWKLALVAKGVAPERLLDSYHDERHPVGARVLQMTMAQATLTRSDPRIDALCETVAELAALEEARTRLAAMVHSLDIHYDLGNAHPLVGRRMPDLDLVTADGAVRVFTLLHDGRGLLLDLGGLGGFDDGRVRVVRAEYAGAWELPVVGAVAAPGAVLVRPDGHVAWAGGAGLGAALATWFG